MTEWVRLWHDMPFDPKWRVIARRSGQPLPCVIAVFNLMMVNASGNAAERGTLKNWCHEDAAAALDMEPEDVEAIIVAMEGKVLNGDRLSGWETRQPKREDGTAAERKARWKEKKERERNATERTGTHLERRNGLETDTDTEKKEEAYASSKEKRCAPDRIGQGEDQPPDTPRKAKPPPAAKRGSRLTDDWRPPPEAVDWAIGEGFASEVISRETDKFRDYWRGESGQRASKRDWTAAWRNWLRNAVERRGSGRQSGGRAGIMDAARRIAADLEREEGAGRADLDRHGGQPDSLGPGDSGWPRLVASGGS